MSPNDLHAYSADGRVTIHASGVWMLAQTLTRARRGPYLIFTIGKAVPGRLMPALDEWGVAIVGETGVDLRQYGLNRELKRRIQIDAPRHPSISTVE